MSIQSDEAPALHISVTEKVHFPISQYEPSFFEPAQLVLVPRKTPFPCSVLQEIQGKGFISSGLNIASWQTWKGWFLSAFVPPFPVGQINQGLGSYWQSTASLLSQETWPLPSSLRNDGSNLHSVSLVSIHLRQACQHYTFIWPMRSPHSWKEKLDAWLPHCSNYLKTFLMLATARACIIQPPYLSQS